MHCKEHGIEMTELQPLEKMTRVHKYYCPKCAKVFEIKKSVISNEDLGKANRRNPTEYEMNEIGLFEQKMSLTTT